MLVQACLNGSRDRRFHPNVPLTPGEIADDAARCMAAGAAEVHVHPRGPDGMESLSPSVIGQAVMALRQRCPGTLVGVSTAAGIENDAGRTLAAINGWTQLPDYASVNLSEHDAPAVIDALQRKGIGVEAGLASVADAERLVQLSTIKPVFRILVESVEQDEKAAWSINEEIIRVLSANRIRRQILLHGFDLTVWKMIDIAGQAIYATRVGLEDGRHLPDGSVAASNVELVSAARGKLHAACGI